MQVNPTNYCDHQCKNLQSYTMFYIATWNYINIILKSLFQKPTTREQLQ